MKPFILRVRRPVRRAGVERYLLLTLLSFGASVALTRLFLSATDYPQLSSGDLHIAHVMWGGLLLFLAALMPLIYANRWAFDLSGILAGVGVGLFIDEVGKFITQNNDYFYPAAAPIIYAFFLMTVLLYFRVRRPLSRSPRAELYRSLDGIEEVLDHDLEPQERRELEQRLTRVANVSEHPAHARLADALLEFLGSDELMIAQRTPGFIENLVARMLRFEAQWISKGRAKAALIGGLLALGVVNTARLMRLVPGETALEQLLEGLIASGQITNSTGAIWFLSRLLLEAAVGLLLVSSVALLLAGRERQGIGLAYAGLLISLTAVNLLVFYFEQFSTIFPALVQFLLLVGALRYRGRYLSTQP
jgi:hypothetical protein